MYSTQRGRAAVAAAATVAAVLFAGQPPPSAAAAAADVTATWQAGTGVNGNWFDATKWSSNPLAPNNGSGGLTFDAVLPATGSGTITTSQNIALERLLIQGSFYRLESTASNTLTVNDTFQLKGNLTDWNQVTARGALLMEPRVSPGVESFIVRTTLNIEGTASWAAGEFQTASATVNIATGATFDIQGDVLFDRDGVAFETSILNNAGLIKKSAGAGTARLRQDLINTGTVEAQSGTLVLERGSSTGTLRALSGAAILFDGGSYTINGTFDDRTLRIGHSAVTLGPGASPVNLQAIDLTDGGLVINTAAPLTVPAFTASGLFSQNRGIITVSNDLIVDGPATLRGVKVSGPGDVYLRGPGVIETSQVRFDGAGLKIEAPTTLRTKLESFNNTVTIAPGASLDIDGDHEIVGAAIVNNGTLRKTGGTGVSPVSTSITGPGAVEVLGGTLQIGGISTFAGAIRGNAGATIEFRNSPRLASGASISTIHARVVDTTLRVSDGAQIPANSMTLASVGQAPLGGKLELGAGSRLTLTDGLAIENGALLGSGVLAGDVTSAGRVSPGSDVGFSNSQLATLRIDGDFDQNPGGVLVSNLSRSGARVLSDLLDVSGDATIAGELRFLVAGTLLDGDTCTVVMADHILNDGFALTQPPLGAGRSLDWSIQPIPTDPAREALVVTVVPEPSPLVCGFGAATISAMARRRRARR